MSGWPHSTRSPFLARQVKPAPRRSTVSTPTCTRTSRPSSRSTSTACPVDTVAKTVPAQGAYTTPPSGRMAAPGPIMPCEKTGSAVSSSAMTKPETGAATSSGRTRHSTGTGPSVVPPATLPPLLGRRSQSPMGHPLINRVEPFMPKRSSSSIPSLQSTAPRRACGATPAPQVVETRIRRRFGRNLVHPNGSWDGGQRAASAQSARQSTGPTLQARVGQGHHTAGPSRNDEVPSRPQAVGPCPCPRFANPHHVHARRATITPAKWARRPRGSRRRREP